LKAKEILLREKRLTVPDLVVVVPPRGRFSAETEHVHRPAALLQLQEVVLERAVGNIRPDVKARTVATPDWPDEDLLVEITVSNAIDANRVERIKARNLPTLEIDLSKLGGRLNEAEFARIIVNGLGGKRWVHHPALGAERQRIEQRRNALLQRTSPPDDLATPHGTDTVTQQSRRPTPQRYESKYPPSENIQRRSFDARRTDFWLTGEEREAWDRRNPDSPYSRFYKKKDDSQS
jgi:hypothetical protein